MKKKKKSAIYAISNRLDKRTDIFYIVENSDWSIKEDGKNIISNLKHLRGKVCVSDRNIPEDAIIHYGSFSLLSKAEKLTRIERRTVIATCFHIVDEEEKYGKLPEYDNYIDKWHTSCTNTKNKMISLGIPRDKIEVIPLGIDLAKYRPCVDSKIREARRRKLGIEPNQFVIASFQKDGNGWGEGDTPKMIKGPDIFCEVIESLANKYDIFVLLSGPARGYVKKRLKSAQVPFYHNYYKNPDDVVELYQLADCYLVTSREEGGPKAILESMACGVPLITTKVGMVKDIVSDMDNAIVVDSFETSDFSKAVELLINDSSIREKLVRNGLKTAYEFNIENVASRYEEVLYRIE